MFSASQTELVAVHPAGSQSSENLAQDCLELISMCLSFGKPPKNQAKLYIIICLLL